MEQLVMGFTLPCSCQRWKFRQPSATLFDDFASHRVAELPVLRHQAQVLVDESCNEKYYLQCYIITSQYISHYLLKSKVWNQCIWDAMECCLFYPNNVTSFLSFHWETNKCYKISIGIVLYIIIMRSIWLLIPSFLCKYHI